MSARSLAKMAGRLLIRAVPRCGIAAAPGRFHAEVCCRQNSCWDSGFILIKPQTGGAFPAVFRKAMRNRMARHRGDTVVRYRGMRCPGHAVRRPSKDEGAGNAGCTPHPLPYAQNKKTRAGQHRYAEITPAFPARWLDDLLCALPGVSGFLVTVPPG